MAEVAAEPREHRQPHQQRERVEGDRRPVEQDAGGGHARTVPEMATSEKLPVPPETEPKAVR